MGKLDRDPSLKVLEEFEDDADDVRDGDNGVDRHDIEIVQGDVASEVLGDDVLATADAGKKAAKEREAAEAKTREAEQKRMEALAANLGDVDSDGTEESSVPQAAPDEEKPAETEKVAQNEIADKQKEVAERSGSLISEGADDVEA